MARSVISYDKDLPEIPGRLPWLKPGAHLVKDGKAQTGWRVEPGRRESRLLLVPKIRTAVDDWRDQGYPGVSDVTRRLFEYWFEEDHDVPGFGAPFLYGACTRARDWDYLLVKGLRRCPSFWMIRATSTIS